MADFKSLEKPKTSFQEQVERLSQRIEAEAFQTLNKSSQEMTEYASCDPAGGSVPLGFLSLDGAANQSEERG